MGKDDDHRISGHNCQVSDITAGFNGSFDMWSVDFDCYSAYTLYCFLSFDVRLKYTS